MSPLSPESHTQPGAPGEARPRPEPGRPVRVTILPRGLAALLSGLILVAIHLVPGPEQQEPESLAQVILRGHRDQVNAVAFAPDGRTLASGGEDCTAVLCDVATSREQPRILQHEAPIYMLSRSPQWPDAGHRRARCDGAALGRDHG